MKLKKAGLALMISSLTVSLLTGCGSNGSTSGSSASGGSSSGHTVIKIASQSPLSGADAIPGESIKLGAQMSLDDHKAEFQKLGFDLQFVPYDDQSDPKKGTANAELISADQSVLGVVGHLNSGVAIPSSVVYEKNNLVMVSAAVSAPAVTDRNLKVVNRLVARDDYQGPAAANYAVNTLKAKNIFVMQDKTAYGQGLTEAFNAAATKLGATIVGYEAITKGEKDFNGVLNIALSKKPDFIYYGGNHTEAGLLIKQARDKGITAPFMGGDALDSSGLVDIAGASVKGTSFTSGAKDITKTPEGLKWAEQYKQKFGKGIEAYSASGYDSMSVILNGIKTAITANGGKMPTRAQVSDAVRATKDFQGISAKVTFDSKGDNNFAKVFIYQFQEAKYPGTLVSEVSK